MHKFLSSRLLLYLLAVLLLLTFFLPALIGPLPGLLVSGVIIAISLFVYNKWSTPPAADDETADPDEKEPDDPASGG